MRIKDISINDIKEGKNWKVLSPENIDWDKISLEELSIRDSSDFNEDYLILYSAVFVSDDEKTTPLVMLKKVGDLDYGGDYCEFVDGRWRQLGLEPNPNAPFGNEYYANPLEKDESFVSDDHDYRKWHRNNFRKYISLLQ